MFEVTCHNNHKKLSHSPWSGLHSLVVCTPPVSWAISFTTALAPWRQAALWFLSCPPVPTVLETYQVPIRFLWDHSAFSVAAELTDIFTDRNHYWEKIFRILWGFNISESHGSSHADQPEWGKSRWRGLIRKPVSVVFVCLADCLPLSAANDVQLSSGPKEYLGMLEYKREDEAKLIQNLILGSKTWNSAFLFSLWKLKHQSIPKCWAGQVPSLPISFFIALPLACGFSPSALLTRYSLLGEWGGLCTIGCWAASLTSAH